MVRVVTEFLNIKNARGGLENLESLFKFANVLLQLAPEVLWC